jgi:hypothetical protein
VSQQNVSNRQHRDRGSSRPNNNGDSSQSLAADVTAEPDADASGEDDVGPILGLGDTGNGNELGKSIEDVPITGENSSPQKEQGSPSADNTLGEGRGTDKESDRLILPQQGDEGLTDTSLTSLEALEYDVFGDSLADFILSTNEAPATDLQVEQDTAMAAPSNVTERAQAKSSKTQSSVYGQAWRRSVIDGLHLVDRAVAGLIKKPDRRRSSRLPCNTRRNYQAPSFYWKNALGDIQRRRAKQYRTIR